ncbi:DNA polymerase III subunit delta' [Advenella sp. S44]|uniref:DNA polymerase III subunit delta' n=1 Tax=Advenella sp. S44 TaxID=1982755 RepID=UPI000C2B3732|nr:DNA polymerase III subunit delta' [Advenella sp. S44]PJX26535.1 DNA polymerase III subunit delta' [Advenella sp. S44]
MSSITQFFPWQTASASRWLGDRERFAHAWLVYGPPGIGKLTFARAAATSLLCERPTGALACGTCQSCSWIANDAHPDLRLVMPDRLAQQYGLQDAATVSDSQEGAATKKASGEIRIDQVRQLDSLLSVTTHRSGMRVIILFPVESLNTASANYLLKSIEEPAPGTVFLLVSHAPDKVLPTLLSRCRRFCLPMPTQAEGLAWLQAQDLSGTQAETWLHASGGAPVGALTLSRASTEPVSYWLGSFAQSLADRIMPEMADYLPKLEKLQPEEWLGSLQRLFVDLMLQSNGLAPRYFPRLGPFITAIAADVSPMKISQTASWLARQQRIADHPLNARLFIQSVLQRVCITCLSKNA